MSEKSILTPSSDFDMDLIFSSWSMINKGNNLYVSMCVMGPLKIKSNQGFITYNTFISELSEE